MTSPPPGTTFRSLDPGADAVALHALDAAAFARASPPASPESLEAFTAEHLGAPDFEPRLSLVAERDGRLAGFLVARWRRSNQCGYIDLLAVRPDAQGIGVGSALLSRALVGFAAAGLRVAELTVSAENATARRLYERHGFTERGDRGPTSS